MENLIPSCHQKKMPPPAPLRIGAEVLLSSDGVTAKPKSSVFSVLVSAIEALTARLEREPA